MKKVSILWSVTTISLGLAFLFLPFAQEKVTVFGLPLYIHEIFVLLAAGAFGVHLWEKKSFREVKDTFVETKWFLIPALVFVLGATVSMLTNPITATTLGQWKSWFILPFLFFLLLLVIGKPREVWMMWLRLWFLGITGMAIGALLQWTMGTLTYDHRLSWPFLSPNMLALFLEPAIILGLLLSFEERSRRMRFGVIFLSFSLLFAIVATRSYAAWVSGVVGAGVFLWLTVRDTKKRWFLCGLLGTLLLFGMIFEMGTSKGNDIFHWNERSSEASRLMIWQSAGKMIADHPVFGIGPGRFQETYLSYQRYFSPYLEWAVPQPHNLFLAVWLETGLIGLIGFFWLLIAWISRVAVALKKNDAEKTKNHLLVVAVSLLAIFCVHGLADTPYFGNALAYFFWATLALGVFSLNDKS